MACRIRKRDHASYWHFCCFGTIKDSMISLILAISASLALNEIPLILINWVFMDNTKIILYVN